MLTFETLVGAILGTAVLNGVAILITKSWPMSVQKILAVSIAMFLLLALGDNATRENEPMQVTFLRVGIAQAIVTFVLLVRQLARKPWAHEDVRSTPEYHPDAANHMNSAINEAYLVLSDFELRTEHDKTISRKPPEKPLQKPPQPQQRHPVAPIIQKFWEKIRNALVILFLIGGVIISAKELFDYLLTAK